MMWYPNSVFTGCDISPICNVNAISSNSFTIIPFVKYPRSPSFLLLGHVEISFAAAPNFLPFLISCKISMA